jgi:surfactin synthase thioesterase subunit
MAPAARALACHPGYRLLLTGHSMGAGVAACLAMLVRSNDADILAAANQG